MADVETQPSAILYLFICRTCLIIRTFSPLGFNQNISDPNAFLFYNHYIKSCFPKTAVKKLVMVVIAAINDARMSMVWPSRSLRNKAQVTLCKAPSKMATGFWSKAIQKGFSSYKLWSWLSYKPNKCLLAFGPQYKAQLFNQVLVWSKWANLAGKHVNILNFYITSCTCAQRLGWWLPHVVAKKKVIKINKSQQIG